MYKFSFCSSYPLRFATNVCCCYRCVCLSEYVHPTRAHTLLLLDANLRRLFFVGGAAPAGMARVTGTGR